MFKVEHKQYGTVLRVYATKYDGEGHLSFLFYDGRWTWRKAIDYKPKQD